jgi:hypothetical protein
LIPENGGEKKRALGPSALGVDPTGSRKPPTFSFLRLAPECGRPRKPRSRPACRKCGEHHLANKIFGAMVLQFFRPEQPAFEALAATWFVNFRHPFRWVYVKA